MNTGFQDFRKKCTVVKLYLKSNHINNQNLHRKSNTDSVFSANRLDSACPLNLGFLDSPNFSLPMPYNMAYNIQKSRPKIKVGQKPYNGLALLYMFH